MIFIFCGCQSNSPTEPPPDETQRLSFTPEDVTISIGQQTALTLRIENLSDSVFAISLQIDYDNTILSFSSVSAAESEDFFGTEAVQFVQDTLSVLHVALSRIQGQPEVSGSGTLCSFQLEGNAAGSTSFEVTPEHLKFYDSKGREIEAQDIEIQSATVSVI